MRYEAVIFDMDGVLVDSEGFWKRAEKEVFTSLGVVVTEGYSEITKSMTTAAVTKFWFDKFPWAAKSLEVVEQMVVSRIIEFIDIEECIVDGAKELIEGLKAKNYKIGLATNSPSRIIPMVLQKLDMCNSFDTVSSAEFENKGKPDPAVYLTTARKLDVAAINCIAIEDSYSGMLAAKQAGMKVVAFTNGNSDLRFDIASYSIERLKDFDVEKLS